MYIIRCVFLEHHHIIVITIRTTMTINATTNSINNNKLHDYYYSNEQCTRNPKNDIEIIGRESNVRSFQVKDYRSY